MMSRIGKSVSVTLFVLSVCAIVRADTLMPEQEAVLRSLARGETRAWAELSPEQCRKLFQKAEAYLTEYKQYHLPHGLNVDLWWTDRTRRAVDWYDGLGDSATWTGHYLAALALRHHVTADPQSRADMIAVLDKFDILTKISGREGYIARYAGPADDPSYKRYYSVYGRGEDPDRPGLGRWAYAGVEPYTALVWLGNSSRDTYDGVNFGLATTWAFVKDKEICQRVKAIVERVADRLNQDNFTIVDGKGHTTRATPSFKAAWVLLILSVNPTKYESLREQYETSLAITLRSENAVRSKWYGEYFANNLSFIRTFVLCVLETDPSRRDALRNALKRMYKDQAVDHLSAHFAAIYMLGTGDSNDNDARATLQGMLYDFSDAPKWAHEVDHRKDPQIEAYSDAYTKYALLTHERVPHDFIWQISPCQSHGSWDRPCEYPAIDMFLPYWMGRVAGAIPGP